MNPRGLGPPDEPTVNKPPAQLGDHGGEIEDGGPLQEPKDNVRIESTGPISVKFNYEVGPVKGALKASGNPKVVLFIVAIGGELGAGGIWVLNTLAGVVTTITVLIMVVLYIATDD